MMYVDKKVAQMLLMKLEGFVSILKEAKRETDTYPLFKSLLIAA